MTDRENHTNVDFLTLRSSENDRNHKKIDERNNPEYVIPEARKLIQQVKIDFKNM